MAGIRGVHLVLVVSLVVVCYGVDLASILVCPEDVEEPFANIDANGTLSAAVSWTEPTINGTLIGTDQWSLSRIYQPGDTFQFGDTVVEYILSTGSDSAKCNFTISVIDDEDPILTGCPGKQKIDVPGSKTTADVTWIEPTAMDNSGQVTLSSTHQPGDEFASGTTEVVYTAVDIDGNSAECSFQITVLGYPHNAYARTDDVYIVGEDDRIITANEVDCLIACIEESAFVCHSVDFKEADEECALSRKDISTDGVTTETNTGYVHWKRLIDNTDPSVDGCPYDLTRPTITAANYTVVRWEPPVFRDSSNIISLTSTHIPGDLFYIGSAEIIYMATDAFDNSATCTFTVIIEDRESPVLSACPESVNFVIPDHYTSDQTEEIVWDPPSCTDNSYSYDLTSSQESGSTFYKGITTVSYTCRDEANNVDACEFTVNIKTIDELSRIDINIELSNVAFSDALANRESTQFKMLESDLLSQIDDVYGDEDNFEDGVVNGFSPGSVLADVTLTFFDDIDDDSQRYYLDKLLQQTVTGQFGDFIVGSIFVLDANGESILVDACYTLPCPDDMVCRASGLICNAVCADNAGYCLNDATCVSRNDLIACSCTSSDYYGIRCQIVDKWSKPEIAAIIFGCVWGVLLIVLLVLFTICRCIERSKRPKRHNSADSVLIEKTNYDMDNKAYIVDPSADMPDTMGLYEDAISEIDDDNNNDELGEQKETYHYHGSIGGTEDDISVMLGSDGHEPSVSGSVVNRTSSVSGSAVYSASGSGADSASGSAYRAHSASGSSRDNLASTSGVQSVSGS